MTSKVKVSVIVPVYNVEEYLDRCMYSLVNQTYENYEVLLINDGSTDSSGSICDRYAETYPFVYTYHKSNGGLSDARNFAIPYIDGDYITYVDSDDYVDNDYIEKLAKIANSEKVDVVIASHIDETEDGVILSKKAFNDKCVMLSSEEALEIMCYEVEFGTTACAKLVSNRLVKEFPFPKGKLYEDLATVYKYIGNAEGIVYLNSPIYHYIQRAGSIRKSNWKPAVMDVMEATSGLMDYIVKKYPQIKSAAVQRYFFSANEVYVRAFGESDYSKIVRPVQNVLRELFKEIRLNKKISRIQLLRYYLLTYFPRLYRTIWILLKRRESWQKRVTKE